MKCHCQFRVSLSVIRCFDSKSREVVSILFSCAGNDWQQLNSSLQHLHGFDSFVLNLKQFKT